MSKAAVREMFIEPLVSGGMQRPKRMTVDEFESEQKQIIEKLSYMQPEALAGLRSYIVRTAPVHKGVQFWPRINVILQFAWGLQAPPARQNDYVVSVLRSALGCRANDEGWLVELFHHLRKFGPPCFKAGGMTELEVKQKAESNRRKRERICEKISDGTVSDDDRQWLSYWRRAEEAALGIMSEREEECVE